MKRIYVVGDVIAAPSERSIAFERQGEGGIGPRQIFEHAIYDCTVHARDTLVIHTTTRGQKQRFVRIKADNECFTQARWRRHAISRECRCQRSEEHTSELQSLMRISYAVFCLKKKKKKE